MPEFTGSVRFIRVGADCGFTTLVEQAPSPAETFILRWGGELTPPDPPARVRIIQSDWIALLRQAMASSIPVTITYGDSNSAIVLNVQIGQ